MKPAPLSVTSVPKRGLAMTLLHGAGVRASGPSESTYSRPSSEKPPRPLSKRSAGRAGASSAGAAGGAGNRGAS